jgi:hypothetical protein
MLGGRVVSKRRKIAGGIFLGCAVIYLAWLSTPPTRHAHELQTILKTRQQTFDEQQRLYATDPTDNTFLDPTFHEYWATKAELASGNVTSGAVTETLQDFLQFYPDDPTGNLTVKQMDQLCLSIHKDPAQFKKARERFATLLPKLKLALDKPVFLVPAPHFLVFKSVCNYIHVRSLCQILDFQASLDAAEDHPDEAAEEALLGIKLGYNLNATSGDVQNMMIAVAMQAIDFQALRDIIVQSRLQPRTLERIVVELERDQLPADALGAAMENEILAIHNSLVNGEGTGISSTVGDRTMAVPMSAYVMRFMGLASRELRLYNNDVQDVLPIAYGKAADVGWLDPSLEQPIYWDDVRGKHGVLSRILIPNVTRSRFQLKLVRAMSAGLRILAAAELYRLKEQTYPSSLDQLNKVGLSPTPQNDPSDQPFQYQLKEGRPQLLIPLAGPGNNNYVSRRGFKYANEILDLTSSRL